MVITCTCFNFIEKGKWDTVIDDKINNYYCFLY